MGKKRERRDVWIEENGTVGMGQEKVEQEGLSGCKKGLEMIDEGKMKDGEGIKDGEVKRQEGGEYLRGREVGMMDGVHMKDGGGGGRGERWRRKEGSGKRRNTHGD